MYSLITIYNFIKTANQQMHSVEIIKYIEIGHLRSNNTMETPGESVPSISQIHI